MTNLQVAGRGQIFFEQVAAVAGQHGANLSIVAVQLACDELLSFEFDEAALQKRP